MTSAASGLAATITVATLLAWNATPAPATTYTIGTFADGTTVDGNCTLREALRAADDNVAVDNCPAGTNKDSILLPNGNYDFYGEAVLDGTGGLEIKSQSSNPFLVTVNLRGAGRFLRMSGGGAYAISGIGIANGNAGVLGGGAIHASNVRLTIHNSRFVANAAASDGGALYYTASGEGTYRLSMTGGTFLNNRALPGWGGAAIVHVGPDNSASFQGVHFMGNSASDSRRDAYGGALGLEASGKGSYAECIGCNFVGNSLVSTASQSGAIGGAAYLLAHESTTIVLRDCRFTGNSASSTGNSRVFVLRASASNGSHIALDRLFIDWNEGVGGLNTYDVWLDSYVISTVAMTNSQLAFGAGSGLLAFAADSSASVQLGHLTVADYPSNGARIVNWGSNPALLQNSIVTFNGDDLRLEGAVSQTTNFIGGDPHFIDGLNGDYHLAPSSPAIDAGTTGVETYQPLDLDRHPRLAGPNTDLGSYERPF